MAEINCLVCGKKKKVYPCHLKSGRAKYCSPECRGKGARRFGEDHHNWKGGKFKIDTGYIMVKSINHPKANRWGYILEHRLIMERKIGRYLSDDERVHHINGLKDDNRIENLLLTTNSKHTTIHGVFKELNKKKNWSVLYKGNGNPFWGRKHTEETKMKIRNARTGNKASEETKNKMRISRRKHIERQLGT